MLNVGHELQSRSSLINQHVFNFKSDAIRVRGDDVDVIGNTVTDTATIRPENDGSNELHHIMYAAQIALANKAHRDGVQIIPPDFIDGCYNQQYACSEIQYVRIAENTFAADWSKMQPIFMGDGLGRCIIVENNKMYSGSEHQISLYGLISGVIEGNTTHNGEPARVRLRPCRIAGGLAGVPSIWIRSFLDEQDDYGCAEAIYFDDPKYLQDERRLMNRSGDNIYLENFDLEGFREQVKGVNAANAEQACVQFHKIARAYGKPAQELIYV